MAAELDALKGPAAELLAPLTGGGRFELSALAGSGNNRGYRVDAGGKTFFLKSYFHDPADTRDRLGAEFAFSRFAWASGVRALPEPLAAEPRHRLGLFEFVEGQPPAPGSIGAAEVDQALAFFEEINRHRSTPPARTLPVASEGCFSIEQHLRSVGRRVEALRGLEAATDNGKRAREFAAVRLAPHWHALVREVEARCAQAGEALSLELPDEERCVSPSDFGFHNALRERSGRLRFVDFEYAGWDDPAKMVCDFFCQVKVPVPGEHRAAFTGRVASAVSKSGALGRRVELLFPVYAVKWCCILLNDFSPVGRKRREFSGVAVEREREIRQLEKAEALLNSIQIKG